MIGICVASMSNERLNLFLRSLSQCYLKGARTIIIGTGESLAINTLNEDVHLINPMLIQEENKRRWYAEIIKMKIEVLQMANDYDFVVLPDDDVVFNPFAFKVAKKIFEENENVNYLSLLHGPGVICDNPIKMSGFDFYHAHSCMGNSLICRWPVFRDDCLEFFEKHGTDNMFDQLFFQFLDERDGTDKHVYTIYGISLAQHCNLISHYIEDRNNDPKQHMAGINFEPLGNPFLLWQVEEI